MRGSGRRHCGGTEPLFGVVGATGGRCGDDDGSRRRHRLATPVKLVLRDIWHGTEPETAASPVLRVRRSRVWPDGASLRIGGAPHHHPGQLSLLPFVCVMCKMTDLEGRSWRDNIRFLGFPENIEGEDTHAFLQKTLPKLTDITFDPPLEFQRTHRLGPRRLDMATRP
ncbi:hypothetical protein NDU88_002223 [Pleurodeles waltl]|uniref:Uncharacterized protein n=1 Tax=Pleurodeles waltl TaxID=8319 RepID=A0AAV7WR15_PLEWA|nr:hypothetical protein NDU88_002223 [Pleurodeles waltl]